MASKKNALTEQWKDIKKELVNELNKDVEKAVEAGAQVMVDELERVSPFMEHGGEHLRDSWEVSNKYKRLRIVGSTKKVPGGRGNQIPLVNILEFSKNSKHRGFMLNAFHRISPQIIEAMKRHLKGGK